MESALQPSENTESSGRWEPPRALIILASLSGLVVATVGLRAAGDLLSSFFLALVLVIVVSPVRNWAARRNLPGWMGPTLMFLAAVGILAVVALSVAFAIIAFGEYAAENTEITSLKDISNWIQSFAGRFGLSATQVTDAIDSINWGGVVSRAVGVLSSFVGIVGTLITVIITMVFITMDTPKFVRLFGEVVVPTRPNLGYAFANFAQNTRRYFKVNAIFGLGVAIADVIICLIFGIPLAIVWGILSFMSSFIPNVGFVIGMIPPVFLALAIRGPGTALAVIAGYVIVNSISDNGLKPKFVGDAVGLSATVTFMSLLFWAWVFGPIGALLAVPLTLFVRAVLVDSDPNGRWAQSLISLELPEPIPEDAADVESIIARDKTP